MSRPTRRAPEPFPVPAADLDRVVRGVHPDPHGILGAHAAGGGVTVRSLQPDADAVTALVAGERLALAPEHGGIWVGTLAGTTVPDYRVEVRHSTNVFCIDEPYRYLPTVGEVDLHLIGEGRHEQLWRALGAQARTCGPANDPVSGASFAVWAPNAAGVRVVGDFNGWDGRAFPMRLLGGSGVWELFVPGVGDGTRYKYDVCGADGRWRHKADPLSSRAEPQPGTASVVFTSGYSWGDQDWMERRSSTNPHSQPMSVYEVHLGSWRQGRSYRQLAVELVGYVHGLGFTHVELLPVMEHPYGGSWGYQVSSYYAPTSRFGDPDDLRYLIDQLHQASIGVLLDWVPAHFPKDEWALARFDGTPLYEHADPRRGEHPEWGTYVFDYGRPEVRNFLIANAVFWLEEFHADGLRVDAVASMLYLDYSRTAGEWTPNQYGGRENLDAVRFLQEMNATCYRRAPGVVTVAEESTAWPGVTRPTSVGGLGFGLKWNMGWMHDTLGYLGRDPVHRQHHHHELTFSLVYAFSETYLLPLSHDEVVHGKRSLLAKMPGDRWQQLANLRAGLAYMWAHPGKQLVFMGTELAQEREWSESGELDWGVLDDVRHQGIFDLVRDLNRLYRSNPSLWSLDHVPEGFDWIDANDAGNNVLSFVRRGRDGAMIACVANFAAVPQDGYRLGLPASGDWAEILNTDAETYGGSGVGNLGVVAAQRLPWHGLPASATLRLPPLGTLWLQRTTRE